ncbi:helix-turn-helix domain-containing protein [Bacteroides fragilis]
MTSISHKIEIKPNNKQKTYFRKAFGCSRLAYNWGLSEWQRRYKAGEKVSTYDLKKSFNAIKKRTIPVRNRSYQVRRSTTIHKFR